MKREVLGKCPVCGEELYVSKLSCHKCDTHIEGNFTLCKFCKLTDDLRKSESSTSVRTSTACPSSPYWPACSKTSVKKFSQSPSHPHFAPNLMATGR